VELEPGKPYTHSYNSSLGRLRISQATLGDRCRGEFVVVQCKVGNKSPVSLCSISKGSYTLDIELEEKKDAVVLEVIGGRNVHLTGFYLGHNGQCGNAKKHGICYGHHIAEGENVVIKKEKLKDQEVEYEETEVNGCRVRTMYSGLVIEDIEVNQNRDAAIAYNGCSVDIHFISQLKRNGCVVQANLDRQPSKFRLGEGTLTKGLDTGINGMRIGERRRLTVPPSMGYCGPSTRSDVPKDAWLIIEVKLMGVNG
ncbi:hypothetical protein MKX03_018699, partial [Papaver bracteatum]